MGKLVYYNSKLKILIVGIVLASLNKTIVIIIWPETKWSSLDQVEIIMILIAIMIFIMIFEDHTHVCAIYWDELWLGVKVQSNLE